MAESEQRAALNRITDERHEKCNSGLSGGDKKRVVEVLGMLDDDEVVIWYCCGQQRKGRNRQGKDTIGVLVATDRRLIYHGRLGFNRETELFALDNVDSVSAVGGALLGNVTITGPGFSFTLERMNKLEASLAVERIRAVLDDNKARKSMSPSVAASSTADEIRKLAQLRDDGLLSDAEFKVQKKKKLLDT